MKSVSNKWISRFIILVLSGCIFSANLSGVAKAADQCALEQQQDRIVLGNGLCQIVWNKTDKGWSGIYQAKVKDQWQTVAWDDVDTDAAYGIVLKGESPKQGVVRANVWGKEYSAIAGGEARPTVNRQSSAEISISWSFEIKDDQNRNWPVKSTYTIQKGNYHVHEKVEFQSPFEVYTQVRYQRGWEAKNISKDFYEWVAHNLTHTGWKVGDASFLILVAQSNGWDGSRGGGGIVRLTNKKDFIHSQEGFHTPTDSAKYNAFHRVPHVVQKDGWIDTRYFDHYTIEHYLIMRPSHLFGSETLDYLDKIHPAQKLPPRYGWKKFMELQVEGSQNVPGLLEDHGDWAHFDLGWYYGFHPDRVHIQKNRQALDWGGNWDLWQAMAFREYDKRYKNDWAKEISQKIFNGIKNQMWQVDDSTTICDGAFWMFRPRTKAEYDKLRNAVPSGEKGGHIRTTSDLWICQTGKIATLLCDVYEDTKDEQFLTMAKKAAGFLFRLQKKDGNLTAGRIHISGTVAYPANLASNSCAIMLWSRLYEITKDKKYKKAAIRCADYTMKNWLNGKEWKMYGGEWDAPGNISSSSAAYATWGFAILYRATGYKPALDAVRWSADWHIMLQARHDTHIGFYQQKAYWRGRDARSTGGFTQGVMDEGYGQLLWNRPEEPYAQYLAWKATNDKRYLESTKAYLVWQTYMQHNCPSDYRFHGGASEGFEWQWDTMNGAGTVYIGETIGCDLTLFALMDDGIYTE